MHFGIVPILNHNSGGIYQYSLTMIEALAAFERESPHRFSLLYNSRKGPPVNMPALPWPMVPLREPKSLSGGLKKIFSPLLAGDPHPAQPTRVPRRMLSPSDPYFPKYKRQIAKRLSEVGIDLLILPAPLTLSFESAYPYVVAIHDLQHRLQPEFPEVSANGEWERREYLFRNAVRFATLIIAESETGKEDILECYGADGAEADLIKVLPYLPPQYILPDVAEEDRHGVREKYHLSERYVFYPAHFWPHKNHVRIVKALGLIRQGMNVEVHVIFCGSYGGEIRQEVFRETMQIARQLSVEGQVHYLGYVPDHDMSALYAEAVGLVMPTFFGPTNIPVLEAWEFGCPVLTSDIRGIREQVGDAAVLVNPRSVESIAEGIYRLWHSESLRAGLAERGRRRLASYSRDDYRRGLLAVVQEAAERILEKKSKLGVRPAYSQGG